MPSRKKKKTQKLNVIRTLLKTAKTFYSLVVRIKKEEKKDWFQFKAIHTPVKKRRSNNHVSVFKRRSKSESYQLTLYCRCFYFDSSRFFPWRFASELERKQQQQQQGNQFLKDEKSSERKRIVIPPFPFFLPRSSQVFFSLLLLMLYYSSSCFLCVCASIIPPALITTRVCVTIFFSSK